MLAPLGGQRTPFHVVENRHAAAGFQQGGAAFDQRGTLRNVAPGVVGDDDVERIGGQVDILNVAQAKLNPIFEAGFFGLRLGAFVADRGHVHPQHIAAKLPGEEDRRTAGAATHVENRGSGPNPGPARKDEHLARQQGAFLTDEITGVAQRRRRPRAAAQGVVETGRRDACLSLRLIHLLCSSCRPHRPQASQRLRRR